MKIVILDTETTGTLEEDRICQLSYLVLNQDGTIEEVHDDLCLAPIAIKFDAMAIHHITPETIENKPKCIDTKAYARLCELNTPQNLMVIQNAKFDLDMLAKEGFSFEMKLVDTFRIMRAKYPLDTPHGLQFKRYQWGLYKKEQAIIDQLGVVVKAHDALGDVIVLKNLFDKLSDEQIIDEMIETCSKPILLEYMPMGKFKGESFVSLALNERSTLHFMLDKFDLDEDLLHTITHYLGASRENIVVKVGFGKYKGQTPVEIAQRDRGYLEWIRDKGENISSELNDEILKVLNS